MFIHYNLINLLMDHRFFYNTVSYNSPVEFLIIKR